MGMIRISILQIKIVKNIELHYKRLENSRLIF